MIKQLLNKLQGKTWGAHCNFCGWDAGSQDLTKEQARRRADLHRKSRHDWIFDTTLRELTIFKRWAVNTIFS